MSDWTLEYEGYEPEQEGLREVLCALGKEVRAEIEHLAQACASKEDYFVDTLALGIARIAAAHHPDPR